MLRGASNYSKWQEIMVNVLLRDDLYEIVDEDPYIFKEKLAAQAPMGENDKPNWIIGGNTHREF